MAKTAASVRKQAPVVAANLRAVMQGRPLTGRYDGYAACPVTTARNRVVLAEFDYEKVPRPTLPFVNMQKERYDMWLLERYGLGFGYLDEYRKAVAAVTPADVQEVARKYIDPEHMVLIAAGAVDAQGKPLPKLPPPKP